LGLDGIKNYTCLQSPEHTTVKTALTSAPNPLPPLCADNSATMAGPAEIQAAVDIAFQKMLETQRSMSTLDVLAQDAEAQGSIAHESPYFSSNSAGVTGLSDKVTLAADAAGAADSTHSIEKEFVVLPGNKARALAEKKRKASAKDTTGQKWYGMPATKITPEIETTLKLMKLRHVFNPKHFMKKDKSKGLPKYFQIGTVVDAPQDFYSEGVSKKKRKKKLVDELIEDRDFRNYHKNKFATLQQEQKKRGRSGKKPKQRKKR